MIAFSPGKIPADTVNNSIVAFQDLLPTVAKTINVKCPKTDNQSMLPPLLWEKAERHVFSHFPDKVNTMKHNLMVRHGE